MKKWEKAVIVIAAVIGLIVGGAAQASATRGGHPEHVPVTICHATGADGIWVEQTVDDDSILNEQHEPVGNGHALHHDGKDIIPPFTTTDGYEFPGQGNQAILENHCKVPAVDPEVHEVTLPSGSVVTSCDDNMYIDVTYGEEPDEPWTFTVYLYAEEGVGVVQLVDDDDESLGFSAEIPLSELPEGDFTYMVDAQNGGTVYEGVFHGEVICRVAEPEPSVTPEPTVTQEPTVTPTKSRPAAPVTAEPTFTG